MTEPNPPGPLPPAEPTALAKPAPREERGILGWARAVVFGVRDTAQDMLDEGRRGAHEAYEEGWRRYDAKTKPTGRKGRRPERR